jgi:glycosyltransferase involved in cell wall biosynthesis
MGGKAKSVDPVICHINLAKGFRGGERQTQLLINELSKLGWRQRLIVRKESALPETVAGVESLQIVEVASNAVAAGFATRGCQLVHAHEARGIYAGLLGRWLFRIPYLATRRVPNLFSRSPLRDLAYRGAARIVGLSRMIATLVEQQYPDTQCEIIPSAHADLARQHQRDPAFVEKYRGKTVIGHIGALHREVKGQHNIIDVARRWQDRHPDVLFVLVGSGKDGAEFKQLAKGLTNIEFAGQVKNVDDYLDLFDIFVFPSLMEGLGSILLDAMCFGLPIVASGVDGIPDIIEDGANGLLVEPDNPEQLGAALERLLGDKALQEKMREENLAKSGRYSAEAMAASYDALYRGMIKGTD